MTPRDVIDTDGEVVEPTGLSTRRESRRDERREELALVAHLLRYVRHLPGCAPARASSCSCGLSRVVQAAVALGCPAPDIAAPADPSSHDAEAALLGGALGGLLGTLMRRSNEREAQRNTPPARDGRDRRDDGPDDSRGERARAVVRKRRSR